MANVYLENTEPAVKQARGILTKLPITANAGVAPVAGGAVGISLGNAAGPNVYTGSGVPTVSAPQGSLYLRTDGSSTSTRAYINTNGSTTWTAVTTAA